MTVTAIRSAVPVPAWGPTTVAVLGGAIHSMTPARGIDADTALRDAALLTRHLAAADRPLLEAIGAYESEMISYGFAAVRAGSYGEDMGHYLDQSMIGWETVLDQQDQVDEILHPGIRPGVVVPGEGVQLLGEVLTTVD
ncbi:hypothetical protein [Nonomuraea sp. B19D2]|uniref:hypothetical protein n=1 Tax=Nonomuraea sp. B19D2 TaxID=3159561 RepID=UPI0032DA489C